MQYDYDQRGKMHRALKQSSNDSSAEEFEYDAEGRLTGVISEDGTPTWIDYAGNTTRISSAAKELSFDHLASGAISEVRTNDAAISADYDERGNLTAFRSEGVLLRLGATRMGGCRTCAIQTGK